MRQTHNTIKIQDKKRSPSCFTRIPSAISTCLFLIVAIFFAVVAIAAAPADAAEVAWSDHYPQIQRLQGVVLFPADIETVEVDMDGDARTQYRFNLYRVRDIGQPIHQDRQKWAEENRKLLYELTYGDLETVVDAIESGTVEALKTTADDVIKRIESEAVKE